MKIGIGRKRVADCTLMAVTNEERGCPGEFKYSPFLYLLVINKRGTYEKGCEYF